MRCNCCSRVVGWSDSSLPHSCDLQTSSQSGMAHAWPHVVYLPIVNSIGCVLSTYPFPGTADHSVVQHNWCSYKIDKQSCGAKGPHGRAVLHLVQLTLGGSQQGCDLACGTAAGHAQQGIAEALTIERKYALPVQQYTMAAVTAYILHASARGCEKERYMTR
jgi:hypothetical protein